MNIDPKGKESGRFHTIEKIRRINHQAMDNYLLSPYDGEIYLFKAGVQNFFAADGKNYGWKPFVNKITLFHPEQTWGKKPVRFRNPDWFPFY